MGNSQEDEANMFSQSMDFLPISLIIFKIKQTSKQQGSAGQGNGNLFN
jgi:hypothetical protein